MNDLMSAGLHRLWKRFAAEQSLTRPGERVLDVAGGTGDLTQLFAQRVGPRGTVIITDINGPMLRRGRDRLLDRGLMIPAVQCDGEKLPFPDGHFDCVCVAFGLRNMTHKDLRWLKCTACSGPAAGCWCWNFHGSGNRWRRCMTPIRFRCCRGWASW